MLEQRSFLELTTDPPEQHLWRINRPQIREIVMEGMRLKGEELQEDIEVDPIPVGMAVTLWDSIQAEISSEKLEEQLGEDAMIVVEEQNSEDEVWNLLADLDSKQDILEALRADETRHKILTELATEGREFQERYLIEYKALTPVDIGFLLKNRRFTLWNPPEVKNKQTA